MNRDYYDSMRDRPMIEDVFDRMETRIERPSGKIRDNKSLNDCFDCTKNDCEERDGF